VADVLQLVRYASGLKDGELELFHKI
jgi:hypothetical protein